MDLKAFLQPPVLNETKKVIVSKRFKGEDGNPVPFTIRVIDQETNNKLIRQATERKKEGGRIVKELNEDKYGKLLVQACVVEPDFRRKELCDHYRTVDPLEVPTRMLSVGEYNRLVLAIRELNEITATDQELFDLEEEVKN